MPDPNLEYELEQAAQNARPFTNARLAPAQMPVDEEELAAAYESARPIPPPAPPADYPMEGSGYSPELPPPGPEYGPEPGRRQVNIGTAARFGTDWGPGENDFGVPGGQRVYGDVPEGMSLQPRIGWQMESQSAAQQRAAAAQAMAAQQAAAARAANPQAQLAELNRLIQQTALSQPEQMRLATLNQAVNQIQTQLDNGSINQDTARRLHAQVTHNAEQLWARQGSLPEMLQRQRYLQAMHDAAEQQSISTHAQYHASQTAQGRLPVAQARLADGTMADFVEESPGRWRHLTAPGGAQQDRAQAQAEQRQQQIWHQHEQLVERVNTQVRQDLLEARRPRAAHETTAEYAARRNPPWMQDLRMPGETQLSPETLHARAVRNRLNSHYDTLRTEEPAPPGLRQQQGGQQGGRQQEGGAPDSRPFTPPPVAEVDRRLSSMQTEFDNVQDRNLRPLVNVFAGHIGAMQSLIRDHGPPASLTGTIREQFLEHERQAAQLRAAIRQRTPRQQPLQQRIGNAYSAGNPTPF